MRSSLGGDGHGIQFSVICQLANPLQSTVTAICNYYLAYQRTCRELQPHSQVLMQEPGNEAKNLLSCYDVMGD